MSTIPSPQGPVPRWTTRPIPTGCPVAPGRRTIRTPRRTRSPTRTNSSPAVTIRPAR
ncbi:hypothetical protein ACFV9C_38065 [Kribbella sp. NPDC059898]|uniref:hypothetical protein n=1 Tax=Kribbella sp. NPDC059898 TaxID=3346995 RepID=UPI003653C2E2